MSSIVVVLILFSIISGIAKVGFGFGAGVLLNPLLTLFVPSATAVTLLAPILWFSNFAGVTTHRKSIQWDLIKKISPISIIGIVSGSVILTYVDDQILKALIGIITILMGGLLLISRRKQKETPDQIVELQERSPAHSIIYQLGSYVAGFAGSTANSAGVPLTVLFLHDPSIKKSAFTANIVVMLAIMDSIKIVSYLVFGILSMKHLLLAVLYIPFIYLGALIGKWLHAKISEKAFFFVAYTMIFLSGIILLF